jgi:hypothetical protein
MHRRAVALAMLLQAVTWALFAQNGREMGRGENVFWGVIAGFITSGALLILGLFYTKVMRPWYADLTYQGVDLRGRWLQIRKTGAADYRYEANLTQRGHDLNGTVEITKTGTGINDYRHEFDLAGTAWEGFVSLTLKSKDRRHLSIATALLKVTERGGRLMGHWIYRSGDDEVGSEPVDLRKERS